MKTTWPTVGLHDICRPKQWKTITTSELTSDGYLVYGANGVIGHYHSYNHEAPTILVGCRGSCGSVTVSEPKSWVTGNAMALDELDTSVVDFCYLVCALRADGLASAVTGTSQPQITQTSLRRISIPLPPIEEQRRIASILDAADALRTKRRQALAKLDTLTQAIFIDMFGVSGESGASPARLSDHAIAITKGTTPTSVGFDFADSGVPFVRVQDLQGGTVRAETIELCISEATNKALSRSILKPCDVVISIAGTIGRVAIIPDSAPEMNCNQAVALVRTSPTLAPVYLAAWLNTQDAQEQIGGSRVTGTISNLSLTSIRNLILPLPGRLAQQRFADRVLEVQRLVQNVETSASNLNISFASLQHRAFRGEL